MRLHRIHGLTITSLGHYLQSDVDYCFELQIRQRGPGGFSAGVVVDHAAALLPTALAFDLVGGRAVLGHAAGPAHPPAVAAEELPIS